MTVIRNHQDNCWAVSPHAQGTPVLPEHVTDGLQAAAACNKDDFKHSEVKKIRRGLLAAVALTQGLETILTGRSTVEEF